MLVKQVLVLGTCYKTNLSRKVQNRTWPSTFTFNRTTPKKHMKMSTPLTKVLGNIISKKYIQFLKTNNALLKNGKETYTKVQIRLFHISIRMFSEFLKAYEMFRKDPRAFLFKLCNTRNHWIKPENLSDVSRL